MKKKVVIGLVGVVLDKGTSHRRWHGWRPSVAICQQEDIIIERYHLLYQASWKNLVEQLKQDIESVSPETEVICDEITFSNAWDFETVYSELHDYANHFKFDPENEEYLIHITTGTHVAQICLFLLTEARYLPGKLLQSSPNKRHGVDSAGTYSIIDLDLSKYDRLATRFLKEHHDDISFLKSGIETRNHEFNTLIEMIEQVAMRSVEPILLTGPTGAGKSQLARRIYELKKLQHQLNGKFIEVNCATLRGNSAMSALFGHQKGSFTGAIQERPGLLRAADKGILFLDEIGELGVDEQAMLLRAIEEKRFLPLGADQESASDFQLICGTNRNLSTAVTTGQFREDLLARINLWTFELPGLSQRPEDIEPNISYELDRVATKTGIRTTFNKEAKSQFLAFATSPEALWKANFRDLNAAITRMSTLSPAGRINIASVNQEINRLKHSWQSTSDETKNSLLIDFLGEADYEQLDLFDRIQLTEVIAICHNSNSLSAAGRKLFAISRQQKSRPNDADRLKKYLARFKLSWDDITDYAKTHSVGFL